MRKLLLTVIYLSVATLAPGLRLESFVVRTPKGHGSYEHRGDGVWAFSMTPETKSAWHVMELVDDVRLDGYKYINFEARGSGSGTRPVYFYLRRELAPGNVASFYRIIEIGPEWETYSLELSRGARSGFRFTKGSKYADMELDRGGKLLSLQVVASEETTLEFRDFRLGLENLGLDPRGGGIGDRVARHPRTRPYTFAEIIKPGAVPLAEFAIFSEAAEGGAGWFAARELSRYLSRVLGREVAVVADADRERVIHLEVRDGSPEEAFGSELLDGENLRLYGNSPRALLYAVYDFLEKACGVRFLAPFEYGEVVPVDAELRLPLFRDSDAPRMTYRCPHYCSYGRRPDAAEHRWRMADWSVKNRFNVELERINDRRAIKEFYALRGGCIWLMENAGHNFHKLIPPGKYFADHPEYFCFDSLKGEWRAERAQLCTTNPDLVAELGRLADAYFERNPEQRYFPLFQEDGRRLWCQCPPCLALNPSGSNSASATENNINLANLVCAEIRRLRPDKGVCTYAYHITERPPVKVLPIKGVRVMYCYYTDGDPVRQPWETMGLGDMLEWSRLTGGDMIIYSYHYLSPRYAFNDETALAGLFRTMDTLGIKGSNQESSESWAGADGYLLYMGARFAWNPWLDEREFKDDYFSKLYGAAGAYVRSMHDILSRNLVDPGNRFRMGSTSYPGMPDTALTEMGVLLDSAAEAVAGDSRAAAAVEAQAGYLRYLSDWTRLMRSGDLFFGGPSKERYDTAKDDLGRLKKTMTELARSRVTSMYALRIITAFETRLDSAWSEE